MTDHGSRAEAAHGGHATNPDTYVPPGAGPCLGGPRSCLEPRRQGGGRGRPPWRQATAAGRPRGRRRRGGPAAAARRFLGRMGGGRGGDQPPRTPRGGVLRPAVDPDPACLRRASRSALRGGAPRHPRPDLRALDPLGRGVVHPHRVGGLHARRQPGVLPALSAAGSRLRRPDRRRLRDRRGDRLAGLLRRRDGAALPAGRRRLGAKSALWTVVFLSVFPTAFFFQAIYSESLFLLLSVACFLAARRGRWALAGAAGFLASLTRNTGLLLARAPRLDVVGAAARRPWAAAGQPPRRGAAGSPRAAGPHHRPAPDAATAHPLVRLARRPCRRASSCTWATSARASGTGCCSIPSSDTGAAPSRGRRRRSGAATPLPSAGCRRCSTAGIVSPHSHDEARAHPARLAQQRHRICRAAARRGASDRSAGDSCPPPTRSTRPRHSSSRSSSRRRCDR